MTTPPTDAFIGDALKEFALLLGMNLEQAMAELLKTRVRLREAHRRTVRDHYTGTGSDAPRYWSCGLCAWSWKHGEPELHEPTCPLAGLDTVLGDA